MMAALLAILAADGLLAIDPGALARGPGSGRGGAGGEVRRAGAVSVIHMAGPLAARTRETWFGTIPGMDRVRAALASATAAADVSAIILDIDSPGGTVLGTEETAAAVRAAAAVKPVVAVANGLAASAAYWIGSGASQFVIAPGGEVGSIGVMMGHTSIAKAQERMGIETTLISSAPYKTELSPYAPLTPEARANLEARVAASHTAFVASVAQGRRVSVAHVNERFGQGRTVDAADAVAAGMADRVATLETVVADLLAGEAPRASAPRRRADVFAFA